MIAAVTGGWPRPHAAAPEGRGAQDDLRRPQAKHVAAHDPQARRLQLQADDEQQQHDAELGDLREPADVADQVQAPWADDQARGDVAEDRGQAHQAKQRHRDDGGGQQDRGFGQGDHGRRGFWQEWVALISPSIVPLPVSGAKALDHRASMRPGGRQLRCVPFHRQVDAAGRGRHRSCKAIAPRRVAQMFFGPERSASSKSAARRPARRHRVRATWPEVLADSCGRYECVLAYPRDDCSAKRKGVCCVVLTHIPRVANVRQNRHMHSWLAACSQLRTSPQSRPPRPMPPFPGRPSARCNGAASVPTAAAAHSRSPGFPASQIPSISGRPPAGCGRRVDAGATWKPIFDAVKALLRSARSPSRPQSEHHLCRHRRGTLRGNIT